MLTSLQKRKLTKLFSMYDVQNTGVLQLSSFEQIAHRLAQLREWKPGTPAYEAIREKYVYRWIRLRGDIEESIHNRLGSRIELKQWLQYYENLLEQEQFRKELKNLGTMIFEVIDLDENGRLDQEEWKRLFQVYHLPVVYLDKVFAQLDTDQDGWLSQEQVLTLLEEFYFSDDPEALGNSMFGLY